MQKTTFIFILVLSFSVKSFSQTPPIIQWQKCLGGSSKDDALSIQQTFEGGYIICGSTFSNDSSVTGNHGRSDSWVVKLNSSGSLQWQKTLGGTLDDLAWSIQQTPDSGYIVAGTTTSTNGDIVGKHSGMDAWIFKLNSSGILIWKKCYGGSKDDGAVSILQTLDGGFIVAGFTQSNDSDVLGNHGQYDGWILKLNLSGNIQWQKCLGGTGTDNAYDIKQLADSSYIVALQTNSNNGDVSGNQGTNDYWVVKLNPSGNILWQKCYGGSVGDAVTSICQTSDGGFIMAGSSGSNDGDITGNHGYSDFWVVKIDSTGILQWQKSLGGSGNDQGMSIINTSDGGYIISGYSTSNDYDVSGNHGYDLWMVKINSSGILQWQKCFGGTAGAGQSAPALKQTIDGGYVFAGYTSSNDGDVSGNHGSSDFWVVKLSSVSTGISETENKSSSAIYPNPSDGNFEIENTLQQNSNITFTIVNLLGEKLWSNSYQLSSGKNTTTIIASFLSPGIYFLRMEDDAKEFTEVRKVLVR